MMTPRQKFWMHLAWFVLSLIAALLSLCAGISCIANTDWKRGIIFLIIAGVCVSTLFASLKSWLTKGVTVASEAERDANYEILKQLVRSWHYARWRDADPESGSTYISTMMMQQAWMAFAAYWKECVGRGALPWRNFSKHRVWKRGAFVTHVIAEIKEARAVAEKREFPWRKKALGQRNPEMENKNFLQLV